VVELLCIAPIALPPNKALQLTAEIVTPFAYAKGAPISSAAEL
jgi:hypothetical protein